MSGSGLIGELYVSGGAGESKVGCKLRDRVWIDGDIIRFTYRVGAASVPGDEGDRIGARC